MLQLRLPLMVIFGLVAGGSLWWRERRRRQAVRERLGTREDFLDGTFVAGLATRATVGEVRQFRAILAETFGVEATQLRPGDRLGTDLGGCELSRPRQLYFVNRLERAFDCALPPADSCLDLTAGELLALALPPASAPES